MSRHCAERCSVLSEISFVDGAAVDLCFYPIPSSFHSCFPGFLIHVFASPHKKALRISSGALLYRTANALINFIKVRITRADHPFRINETVYVNRDPAAVHEHEVLVADEPEIAFSVSLDEELFRMPPETEHLAMTRPELCLVYGRVDS